ncbi:metallophosphoesterase [bacterium LRH843]|nr:metallophosphoesterase [bacterium LRH843]
MISAVIAIIIAALLFILYMWAEAFRNRIRIHTLAYDQLPISFHGYRLFFISDVHRRLIPMKLIDTLRSQVDHVVIGGDFCEKGVKMERIEENIKRLAQLAPIIFVWGNNDEEVGKERLRSLLKNYNVEELINSVKTIKRGNEKINIAGVDDVGHSRDDLVKVVKESIGTFSVLISHYPIITQELPRIHPFSLVLSGHTHGGQIRFFGWGLEQKGRLVTHPSYTHLISNGFGTTGVPMRLGAPAEAHLLVLVKK